MKKLFCLAALTAVMGLAMSQSAMADQQGTVHFTGNVTANTCTLSGQDITHDLGAFSTADSWARTSYAVFKNIDDTIEVSGCPASVGTVVMTPAFTPSASGASVKNDGTAGNVELALSSGPAGFGAPYITNGNPISFTVNEGAASIPIRQHYAHDKTTTKTTMGTLDFSTTFEFAYQ